MLNNIRQLQKNITDQIIEAQLKLGFVKETMRFYYPLDSLNTLLGGSYDTPKDMCRELEKAYPGFHFCVHEERIEVSAPADYVEYVHKNVSPSTFLAELVEAFKQNHFLTLSQIEGVFAEFGEYCCEEMPEGADFDYVIYFTDSGVDEYYYCVKMEMGHTIYHRFLKSDYEKLV